MFSEVPSVLKEMSYQIVLIGIVTIFAGSVATGSTIFRVINKANVFSLLMIVNQTFLATLISSVSLFYFNLRAAGIGYGFICSFISTFIWTVVYITKFDWKNMGKTDEVSSSAIPK